MEEKKFVTLSHTWFTPFEDREITCAFRFTAAGRAEVSRFNKEVLKSASAAQQNLVVGVIHPEDKDGFLAEAEKYPGLMLTFSSQILKASGLAGDLGN